jgi:hypothetical protein
MDKQQRYLYTGAAGAMAILLFVKAFAAYNSNVEFWWLIFGVIATTMISLILNIFLVTQTIKANAKAILVAQKQHNR